MMMNVKYIVFVLFTFLFVGKLSAQVRSDSNLVQFTGMVLDGTTEELFPVPYTNILVTDKGRGTYSDFKGFFSIVVEKGDKIEFSAIGYKTVEFEIPVDLDEKHYSLVQLMTQDTFNLPETVVFPWPSREHFKQDFLAMDVTSEMQALATTNLAQSVLEKARDVVPTDGNESADFYLRQQAKNYYHIGQTPPMNIFSPLAWNKFFKAWKEGDFKKKSKKKKEKKKDEKEPKPFMIQN